MLQDQNARNAQVEISFRVHLFTDLTWRENGEKSPLFTLENVSNRV